MPSNRIVAMYHSESATSVKNAVSTSLSDPSGVVRRVFATQSLSMGIHCLNIREVIHWGIPRALEQYFQECGRAGRDGLPAKATLLHTRGQLCEKFCSKPVIYYCNSSVCYRRMLLTYFNVCQKMIKILCPMLVLVVHCVLQNVVNNRKYYCVWGEGGGRDREEEGRGRRRGKRGGGGGRGGEMKILNMNV